MNEVAIRMGWTLAVLVVVAALVLLGHRAMIAVKPEAVRPAIEARVHGQIAALQARPMQHVSVLGSRIGERNLTRPEALAAAVEYIRTVWTSQGFTVAEEGYDVAGRRVANLVVEHRRQAQPQVVILVGAHYDSGVGSPGANDNATGVAALLELSRTLKGRALARTVRLVAFVNEEPPYFMTELMGSRVNARQARRRGERIAAMLSLETLGYYTNTPGSQRYPFPFGAFYPHVGNFLAVVGNLPSRGLAVDLLRHFMTGSDFPVEGVATFGWIPGINWSDHWSFWKAGYPALMLTDTAPFRYPFYHGPHDLPEKINAPEFARAAHGIIEAVIRLASREWPPNA